MKIQKKIIFSLVLMISLLNANASTFKQQNGCVDFALDMVEDDEIEGCLDAQTATELYNFYYEACEELF